MSWCRSFLAILICIVGNCQFGWVEYWDVQKRNIFFPAASDLLWSQPSFLNNVVRTFCYCVLVSVVNTSLPCLPGRSWFGTLGNWTPRSFPICGAPWPHKQELQNLKTTPRSTLSSRSNSSPSPVIFRPSLFPKTACRHVTSCNSATFSLSSLQRSQGQSSGHVRGEVQAIQGRQVFDKSWEIPSAYLKKEDRLRRGVNLTTCLKHPCCMGLIVTGVYNIFVSTYGKVVNAACEGKPYESMWPCEVLLVVT